jgi:inner membrane protein
MATVITHALTAAGAGLAGFRERFPWRVYEIAAICAIFPDIDVLAFACGIPYEHPLGHRGLTHSLAFALPVGIIGAWVAIRVYPELVAKRRALAVYYALVTASHGLMDAMTNGGLGVAFFAPFWNERYFLPWTPIEVSPIGRYFFSRRGVEVLLNEALWIWLPVALVGLWGQTRNCRTYWNCLRRWILKIPIFGP